MKIPDEIVREAAKAIRRNKFERNGIAKHFDESEITEIELIEAAAAGAVFARWAFEEAAKVTEAVAGNDTVICSAEASQLGFRIACREAAAAIRARKDEP